VPTAIAPTIGPILGGWLVDNASWRWIFYINLPVGVLAFLFSAFILREHTEESVGRFDLPGFLLAGAGLPLMLYALSEGPTAGWTSARVLGLGLLGIALMAALIIVELRVRQPMLALRLFSNRSFRTGNLAVFIMFGGLLGVLFLLPLYLQQLRGLSAFHSGLTTFPQALGMVLTAQLASRLYPIIGPRRMVLGAMAFGAFVTLLFARVGLDTNLWWIRGLMFMRGITMGFSMIPVQAATYATIKPMDTGRASSLFSTNRQVAGSLGVALLATVLVDRSATHVTAALRGATSPTAIQAATAHGTLLGFQDAFFIAAFLYALGFAFAFLINDADAAPSMRRRGTPARQTTPRAEEAVAAGSVAGPAGALEPARRA
jgi:EmrB/QacA subfamily drug resistance transporter